MCKDYQSIKKIADLCEANKCDMTQDETTPTRALSVLLAELSDELSGRKAQFYAYAPLPPFAGGAKAPSAPTSSYSKYL